MNLLVKLNIKVKCTMQTHWTIIENSRYYIKKLILNKKFLIFLHKVNCISLINNSQLYHL